MAHVRDISGEKMGVSSEGDLGIGVMNGRAGVWGLFSGWWHRGYMVGTVRRRKWSCVGKDSTQPHFRYTDWNQLKFCYCRIVSEALSFAVRTFKTTGRIKCPSLLLCVEFLRICRTLFPDTDWPKNMFTQQQLVSQLLSADNCSRKVTVVVLNTYIRLPNCQWWLM